MPVVKRSITLKSHLRDLCERPLPLVVEIRRARRAGPVAIPVLRLPTSEHIPEPFEARTARLGDGCMFVVVKSGECARRLPRYDGCSANRGLVFQRGVDEAREPAQFGLGRRQHVLESEIQQPVGRQIGEHVQRDTNHGVVLVRYVAQGIARDGGIIGREARLG